MRLLQRLRSVSALWAAALDGAARRGEASGDGSDGSRPGSASSLKVLGDLTSFSMRSHAAHVR